MLLLSLAAAVLTVLAPQAEPDIDSLLAPAMTPDQVAAFCFAPANRQPGERDRECQYRVLREDPVRVARIDALRRRCERQANSPGGTVEQCVERIILAERAAAEAARLERAQAAERARAGDDLFGDLFSVTQAAKPAPAPAPEPYAPPRPNCRRETTQHPDGTGGSVTWVCGDERLDGMMRDLLRPQ